MPFFFFFFFSSLLTNALLWKVRGFHCIWKGWAVVFVYLQVGWLSYHTLLSSRTKKLRPSMSPLSTPFVASSFSVCSSLLKMLGMLDMMMDRVCCDPFLDAGNLWWRKDCKRVLSVPEKECSHSVFITKTQSITTKQPCCTCQCNHRENKQWRATQRWALGGRSCCHHHHPCFEASQW